MRHRVIDLPAGQAHLERIPGGFSIDVDAPDDEAAVEVLRAALAHVTEAGGGVARLWVRGGHAPTRAAAMALGLEEERSLHELRRPLPVGEAWDLDVRPFVVGRDEAAWLEVNNRAFAWHPEQGGWTLTDLEERFAEPWFDPAGFLLHEEGGRLLGFCWTKAHLAQESPLGEIYVLAVDPDAGGRGLGRSLTLAGLDHLHRQRGLSVGMLYVDGGNEAGLALYDRLGFEVHRTDTAWTTQVRP
jgi:mycothiol synthase